MKMEGKDKEIFDLVKHEIEREEYSLILIASENYVDEEILEVQGCVLTNKYAEGYPSKRYYSGCQFLDEIESIAIERAKTLFNAEHANVQPHSGSAANMAVYFAALNIGDKVLGMDIAHGGHLTHGARVSFSGKLYQTVGYQVSKENEILDYDEIRKVALAEKPKMIIAGASAYSRFIDFKKFREIADEVGAYLMVDMAHIAGLVAAGLHPDPIEFCSFCDYHDPQDLTRTAGRDDPLQEGICQGYRFCSFSRYPGWSAHACDCCKGCCLGTGYD